MTDSKATSAKGMSLEGGAGAERTDAYAQCDGPSRARPTCSDITLGYNPCLWKIPNWAVHELGDVPTWFESDYRQLPDWFLPERPGVQAILPDLQLMQLLMRVPELRQNRREVRVAPVGMEDMLAAMCPPDASNSTYVPLTKMAFVPISKELPAGCFGAGLGELGYGFRIVAFVVSRPDGRDELSSFERTIRGREPDAAEWEVPGEKERLYSLWHLELLKKVLHVGTPPVYASRPETLSKAQARLAVDILQLVVYGVTSRRQDFDKLLQQVKDKHACHEQKAAS